jgi:hypothetical protein
LWDTIPLTDPAVKPPNATALHRPHPPAMSSTSQIVLTHVLRLMRPVVRLLLRNGVTYTTFAAALKQVFVDVARLELAEQRMPQTDSAVTLLSGVHRRDVRQLTREAADSPLRPKEPLSLAAQVVARWMNEPGFVDRSGAPRTLPRGPEPGGFDELVAGVSRDVRPKAMLDELVRLGVVDLDDSGVTLHGHGFAPRQGLVELITITQQNLHDHLAAAVSNLGGRQGFLEQAVFVDEITALSAERLHEVSVEAWKQAFKTVMAEAQTRFDDDAQRAAPADRNHRARFGVYFYSGRES